MIVSVNSKPELLEFKKLMKRTDQLLNEDAKKRPSIMLLEAGIR